MTALVAVVPTLVSGRSCPVVFEQKCEEVPREVCEGSDTSSYRGKRESVCHYEWVEECETVPVHEEHCEEVPREVCREAYRGRVDRETVYELECETVPSYEQQCEEVPREVCEVWKESGRSSSADQN